jgi:hypothetical protein
MVYAIPTWSAPGAKTFTCRFPPGQLLAGPDGCFRACLAGTARGATSGTIVALTEVVPAAVQGTRPQGARPQGIHPSVSNVIPEAASDTIYAKIAAINPQSREVTLAAANGRKVTVIAASQVPPDKVKVGDRVNVHYYRCVTFLVSKSMQVPREGERTQLPPDQAKLLQRQAQAQAPGGVNVRMTQVSGLVVGVRPGAHTVDVVNPTGGGVYTIQASDPSRDALINSLKVGAMVTAVVSPPIATSIEPERGLRSLFNW